MKTITKIKIKKLFGRDIWQYILVIAGIALFAYIFDKTVEAVLFCISHLVLRPCFEKQYHCKTTASCLTLTLMITALGIYTTLPRSVCLISAVPVAAFVCWVGCIAQDRVDARKTISKLKTKSIWSMTAEELADYCWSKGIKGDKLEFVQLVIIEQMKYNEIAKQLYVSPLTLNDWSKECKEKLGIKSWKKGT